MASRVIVLGSINLDLVAKVHNHPQPGETVLGADFQTLPGGKGANQALAAARKLETASNVILIGAVGRDDFADLALGNLQTDGVDLSFVESSEATTGIAMIAVSEKGENNIIVCPGANADVQAESLQKLGLNKSDVLLTQQEIPSDEIWRGHAIAASGGATIIHNSAPANKIPKGALDNIDIFVANETEAISFGQHLEIAGADAVSICTELADLFDLTLILTLGERGVVCFSGGKQTSFPAKAVNVVDTTGAGDVFCGTLAAFIAGGKSLEDAIAGAIDNASQACTVFGAQTAFAT